MPRVNKVGVDLAMSLCKGAFSQCSARLTYKEMIKRDQETKLDICRVGMATTFCCHSNVKFATSGTCAVGIRSRGSRVMKC
jgi:hypothetical protein